MCYSQLSKDIDGELELVSRCRYIEMTGFLGQLLPQLQEGILQFFELIDADN